MHLSTGPSTMAVSRGWLVLTVAVAAQDAWAQGQHAIAACDRDYLSSTLQYALSRNAFQLA
jgi:hypothetical protein